MAQGLARKTAHCAGAAAMSASPPRRRFICRVGQARAKRVRRRHDEGRKAQARESHTAAEATSGTADRRRNTRRVDMSSRFFSVDTRSKGPRAVIHGAAQGNETAMIVFNLVRFLRQRRAYWNVVHELSSYTDRELIDLGIARVDIHAIARVAAKENRLAA
jgi:uncharacterized protein YjiS (DUF1127 family)